MSSQPTVTQIRLKNITTSLRVAVNTLDVLSQTLESPFLKPISSTSQSLLTVAETVRLNKGECAELLEQTYKMLYALITVYMKAETIGELSPSMLNHVAQFTETLHKIHTFLEAQRDSRIKQFFRQGEMTGLFKECKVGLQQALDVFTIQEGEILKDVTHLQENAVRKHQEVLELMEALSDTESSDRASSVRLRGLPPWYVMFHARFEAAHSEPMFESSNSISLLPSEPKIFHGREEELSSVLKLFDQDKPRIAILGAGGMGKTSLARAILHHPVVAQRYQQHRFFVACDSASTKLELAALIGTYLGLKPAKDLTRPVIQYFSDESECLLVLDNLETVWEPTETRTEIEDFLSALTGVAHLALIVSSSDVCLV
ncbi:hypothetical protein C8R43DRAFT_1105222 [Mycena crocata]|nr:hypothetical protein C8R43DRAFT_1105222 [Mycena crocata]